ncbi:hypothetical protein V6N13_074234 [Hibiscus sabdariffa]
MEARQLQFIEETKLFKTPWSIFFHSNSQRLSPSSSPIITPHPHSTSLLPPNPKLLPTHPLKRETRRKCINDAFDWDTPFEHRIPPRPHSKPADILKSSNA